MHDIVDLALCNIKFSLAELTETVDLEVDCHDTCIEGHPLDPLNAL